MKKHFLLALKIYKYLAIAFAVTFYIYMVIDDYPLTNYHESASDVWFHYSGLLIFVFIYSIAGAVYYWALASFMILLNRLLSKSKCKLGNFVRGN